MKKRPSFLRRSSSSKGCHNKADNDKDWMYDVQQHSITQCQQEKDEQVQEQEQEQDEEDRQQQQQHEATAVFEKQSTTTTTIVAVSVAEACYELSMYCQDDDAEPMQVAQWLERLHHALLLSSSTTTTTSWDNPYTYVPLDVYECISKAALRFPNNHRHDENERRSRKENDDDDDESRIRRDVHDDDDVWTVWEEALWAVAALARVCVGRAWRHQLRMRRIKLQHHQQHDHQQQHYGDGGGGGRSAARRKVDRQHDPNVSHSETQPSVSIGSTTEAAVVAESSSSSSSSSSHPPPSPTITPFHYSTTMNSSSSTEPQRRKHDFFPILIPEQLPTAMLHFATMDVFRPSFIDYSSIENSNNNNDDDEWHSKWTERIKSLTEAQRELVMALCYILPEEEDEEEERAQDQTPLRNDNDDDDDATYNDATSLLEWTILEAHEPVARLILFWLESATVSWNLSTIDANEDVDDDDDKWPAVEFESNKCQDAAVPDTLEPKQSKESIAASSTARHGPQQHDGSSERVKRVLHKRVLSGRLYCDEIDWWTTFQVVRDIFQLVSAGWRIPQDEGGQQIVVHLLGITERGMTLRVDELKSHRTETDRVAREERLAASSSAGTAVSILSSLASVGLIPPSVQPTTVKVMCRIQVKATDSLSASDDALFPKADTLDLPEYREWESDYKTFLEQRKDCTSDIAALLWVLLAHSASATASMSTLLEFMLVNYSSVEDTEHRDAMRENSTKRATLGDSAVGLESLAQRIKFACVAVDVVSGGLWGKPPDTPRLPDLRICWFNVLGAFRTIALQVHDWIVEVDGTWTDNNMDDSPKERMNFVHSALVLLREVIVSFKRFIHEGLLLGEGLLAPDEWEAVVDLLDQNITNWLCMTDETSAFQAETATINKIRSEVGLLLDGIRQFFCHCIQFETSPFNLVVDDECRVKLFSLLLQKAVPYMNAKEGTNLALAVLRCWSITGFSISRSDSWGRTASYMITDVFSVFENQGFGLYGGHVHSPLVRLEAIKLIALEEEDDHCQVSSTETQLETSRHSSPLEQSEHLREQYLALVNGSLLPPLMNMFSVQSSNIHVAVVLPVPTASFSRRRRQIDDVIYGPKTDRDGEKRSTRCDEHALRTFATKLLGRLYRSGTGEKWHRSSLLKMLLSAAINNATYEFKSSTKLATSEEAAVEAVPEIYFSGESHTSLQAIHELEKCLRLPFGNLPSAHESLPPVVDALCSVLIVYGGEPLRERKEIDESWLVMKRYLAVAALLPLVRLALDHDGRLLLRDRLDISAFVPVHVLQLIVAGHQENDNSGQVNYEGYQEPEVAPFVTVSNDYLQDDLQHASTTARSNTGGTQLSFVSAFSSILATLHTNLESKRVRDSVSATIVAHDIDCQVVDVLDSRFRALCFEAIGSFVRAGLKFPFTKEIIPILQGEVSNVSVDEASAKCRCAAAVAENLAARFEIAPETTSIEGFESLLQHILSYFASSQSGCVLIGCRLLRGLVGFVAEKNLQSGCLLCSTLINRLEVEMEKSQESSGTVSPDCVESQLIFESLISLFYDFVSGSTGQDCHFPSYGDLWRTFDICLKLSRRLDSIHSSNSCGLLCTQLLAVLLDNLCSYDAELSRDAVIARFNDWVSSRFEKSEQPSGELFQEDEQSNLMVIGDLLAQKLLPLRDLSSDPKSIDETYHEKTARETDDIDRFIVEAIDTGKEATSATWLCGENTLLTIRLGSGASRYRGWLEIVCRSPTSRRRRLVRLPSALSLDYPELPSSLWHHSSHQTDEVTKATKNQPAETATRCTESSAQMEKALSAMKRFDEMFGQQSKNARPENNASSSIQHSGTKSEESGHVSVSSPFDGPLIETAGSIEEWLHRVLQDPAKERFVVDELCALKILQSAETTINATDTAVSTYLLPAVRLSFTPKLRRAISVIDRIPPLNTHKIALLFVSDAPTFANSTEPPSLEDLLLTPTFASAQFISFTERLGRIVLTRHLKYYSGGLDTSGLDADGKLSVVWLDRDDFLARSMIVFHVVPMMPKGTNSRKSHVGNDNVQIIYVDPGCKLDRILRRGQRNETMTSKVVGGQFGFVLVFVQTLTNAALYKVSVCLRAGLTEDMHSRLRHLVSEHVVSCASAPSLVRRIAARADASCCSFVTDQLGRASNWEERRMQITATQRHRLASAGT